MSPQTACNKAKTAFPEDPDEALGPIVRMQWLMIKSRRKGLSEEEFREYVDIVDKNSEEISKWHERWLCSVFDTYAENGEAVFLVFSVMRMMEKMACPRKSISDQFVRSVSLNNMDIHTALACRIKKLQKGHPYMSKLTTSMLKQIEADKGSVLGRVSLLRKSGESVVDGMNRILK